MSNILKGSCNCGSVVFEASDKPVIELCCHCSDCQDATKQAYAKIAFFKKDAVTIEGERESRRYVADSGSSTARELCKNCGSVLLDTSEGFPRLIGILIDNIHQPFEFKPSCHVWTQSKSPEVVIEQGIKTYEKGITK